MARRLASLLVAAIALAALLVAPQLASGAAGPEAQDRVGAFDRAAADRIGGRSDESPCKRSGSAVNSGEIASAYLVAGRGGGSALDEASEAAFRAARGPISVKPKHYPGTGGGWSKFAQGVDIDATVREALQSPGVIFRPNRDAAGNLIPGYRTYTDLGRTVGTRGETGVRVIVTPDGAVKTAFPGRPWG